MKKQLFVLTFLIGLLVHTNENIFAYADKNHGAELLKDKEWHVLTYITNTNEDDVDNEHKATISIKQRTATGSYDFKSNSEVEMLEFYSWLTNTFCMEQISMEKTNNGYVGSFYRSTFILGLNCSESFVGIDVD